MKSPRDLLPAFTGAVFFLLCLAFAWWSLSAFLQMNYGSALIYAGGAIAVGTLPLSRMSKRDLFKSMNELATEASRKPEPLPLRVAIGVAWILILAGLISFFL